MSTYYCHVCEAPCDVKYLESVANVNVNANADVNSNEESHTNESSSSSTSADAHSQATGQKKQLQCVRCGEAFVEEVNSEVGASSSNVASTTLPNPGSATDAASSPPVGSGSQQYPHNPSSAAPNVNSSNLNSLPPQPVRMQFNFPFAPGMMMPGMMRNPVAPPTSNDSAPNGSPSATPFIPHPQQFSMQFAVRPNPNGPHSNVQAINPNPQPGTGGAPVFPNQPIPGVRYQFSFPMRPNNNQVPLPHPQQQPPLGNAASATSASAPQIPSSVNPQDTASGPNPPSATNFARPIPISFMPGHPPPPYGALPSFANATAPNNNSQNPSSQSQQQMPQPQFPFPFQIQLPFMNMVPNANGNAVPQANVAGVPNVPPNMFPFPINILPNQPSPNAGGQPPPPNGFPFPINFQPIVGNIGDYVFGGENAMEAIRSQLMNLGQQMNMPRTTPTSQAFINALPIIEATESIVQEAVPKECVICHEEFALNQRLYELPCKHLFHVDCISPWLQNHNTCALCRHVLPTDQPPQQTPLFQQFVFPNPSQHPPPAPASASPSSTSSSSSSNSSSSSPSPSPSPTSQSPPNP